MSAVLDPVVTIRFLEQHEISRLTSVYRLNGEPLPDENATVLVVERDGEIVASMAFHKVLVLGLTHEKVDGAIGLLAKAANELFKPGDSVFTVASNEWGIKQAEDAGMVKVEGQLLRKDF